MDLNYKKNGNTIVVYLKGKLDVHQVDDVEKEIKLLLSLETSSHFLLDLKNIDYVSSSGIGLFVTIMNILKQREKSFGICSLNSPVKRIMEIVEMNALFNIFRDETEAVEFFSTLN
jgi:anti-anti-sigma factor